MDEDEIAERIGGLQIAVGLLAAALHRLNPPSLQAAHRELALRLAATGSAPEGPATRLARAQLLQARTLLAPS